MADKIRYAISVVPIEELTDENSNTHNVISGEVGKTLGASGEAVLTNYSGSGAIQGYTNGAPYYMEARHTSPSSISDEVSASFVFIKNTGYTYSSSSVLGDALATQSLKVMIDSTVISLLDAGEAIVLKDDNANIDCSNINVRSVSSLGVNNTGGSLAVEFLVVD